MAEQRGIAPIIHQIWHDKDVPPRCQAWVESWRRHHPGWKYRLWTQVECRALLAEHYRWFLPIYDRYPEGVMRAEAGRYFILDRFGGVYVDLDFECLRPVDALLAGQELVVGLEPQEHVQLLSAHRSGLPRLVGTGFLAARPGHPFLAHVHRQLVGSHTHSGSLDATGTFMLTRAVDQAPGDCRITVLAARTLYPLLRPVAAELFGDRPVDRDHAYAVHHWADSWGRDVSVPAQSMAGRQIPFWTSQDLRPRAKGGLDLDPQRERWASGAPAPTVSCLMVTKDRLSWAMRALRCFLAQTYPSVELVVVDDSADGALEDHVRALADPRIRFRRLLPEGRTLGELRNIAVDLATGPYVCQWDDDDLYDPERVEVQMAALLGLDATACFLARERLWWPKRRLLAVSGARVWEGSMVCAKEVLPRYPAQRRGEDTPVAEAVLRAGRVVSVDAPELYTYVYHGNNTFDEPHFAGLFDAATHVWVSGPAYAGHLRAMAARLPLDPADLVRAERPPTGPAPDTAPHTAGDAPRLLPQARRPATGAAESAPAPGVAESGSAPGVAVSGSASGVAESAPAPAPAAERPSVLVLTPVKDAVAFLPRYLENLRALDYPRDAVSVGLLEGDSHDGTWEALRDALPALEAEFRRVTLVRRHFGFQLTGPRWEPAAQRQRRSVLARARNQLLSRALGEEEWVLWLDVDVTDYPPDLIQRLLGAREEIVVPHCVAEPGGPTFDLNTFVLHPNAAALDWSRWLRDGILQPPRGFGRSYLEDLRGHERVRVDAVGGTALLVHANLHRDGLVFPTVPYRELIETEGLAALAQDMGVECWALPGVEVVHPRHWGGGPLSRTGEAGLGAEAQGSVDR
ncbi:glycosyltransferase [Streptomyces sp. SRF1]|uniref:glycosyltransferase n=1 Tax=Streptomyces sp. SRF1 TaxID=1549642 RepID=UPI0025B0A933|nr:glycosyltransferase [Streptomyces sp. SRF1]MDN3055149.1 glycosyltransferase [Streptomyces sp. SRF1]